MLIDLRISAGIHALTFGFGQRQLASPPRELTALRHAASRGS
jgi:hypothetical protein